MKKCCFILFMAMSIFTAHAQRREVTLTLMHTSDVHGSVFNYDFLKQKALRSGLPSVYSVADSLRRELGERFILTDGGDDLQGQPTAYYYNFIDTTSTHLIADVMNCMGYVCTVMGNHDVETGHAVFDRWIRDLNMPILGANVIDTRTGKPYLTPYLIIKRAGVKIALLGMVTPGIPNWLPERLWTNMRFDDITESCQKWMKIIQDTEHPDLVIGVFHSGFNGGILTPACRENAVEDAATKVPGFDLIVYGHDHRAKVTTLKNVDGKDVVCAGPTNAAVRYVLANISLTFDGDKLVDKRVTASSPFASTGFDTEKTALFEADFVNERLTVANWVNQPIGSLTEDMNERDAYFGPSKFIDFIHQMQLDLTGAAVSFAAPLSYDNHIKAGQLTVKDMFNIYKFENFLYTMRLTGKEILGALEMSYDLWTNQMHSAADDVFQMGPSTYYNGKISFTNLTYNMDSAAGILYTVDVTKPEGQRVHIISMDDGTPFDLNKEYKVAINSYRGNGGGELLTRGAGIPREELASRIITSTDKDLRYYMMQRIMKEGTVTPKLLNCWRFEPEEWTKPALERARKVLFGD